jgi:hypothetical protein
MIATDRLVFLHLHKSGGTFVNALLMHCMPTARQIGYHLPYRELPAAYRGLPVVGTVRSPWAYYVSWYHFQRSQPNPNILFLICSDEGRLDFKATITNLVGLSADEARLATFEEGVPDSFTNHGLNLTKNCVGELRRSQLGFYSFLYQRLYAGAPDPTILRMEGLRQELRSTLTTLGHLPNGCADRFLREVPPLNISRHEAPSNYFDDELAALVATRDRTVIERYGYTL